MKYLPLQHLAPCMAATLIALTVTSTRGQSPVHVDSIPADPIPVHSVLGEHSHVDADGNTIISSSTGTAGSYVGDMSSEDAGITGGTINGRCYDQPDLFYNFYTQGYANRANAQMYLSPLPVPPNVGHTFFTYQPFYPHEMLYKHTNKFHSYYDNGRGANRTRASYYYPPVHQAISNVYWNYLRLPR